MSWSQTPGNGSSCSPVQGWVQRPGLQVGWGGADLLPLALSTSHTKACAHLVPYRSSPSPLPALSFSSLCCMPNKIKKFQILPPCLKFSDSRVPPLPTSVETAQPSPQTMCRKHQRDRQLPLTPGPKPCRCPQWVLASSPETPEAFPRHEPQDMACSKGTSVCTCPSQTPRAW